MRKYNIPKKPQDRYNQRLALIDDTTFWNADKTIEVLSSNKKSNFLK